MDKVRQVDFDPRTRELIAEAVFNILGGFCTKTEVSKNVKVYECKNVIRIDLKITEGK